MMVELPLLKPAFYTHVLSAFMMMIGLILFLLNYKRLLRSDSIHLAMLLLIASIAIAIHGHGHIMLEKMYGYDPLYQLMK